MIIVKNLMEASLTEEDCITQSLQMERQRGAPVAGNLLRDHLTGRKYSTILITPLYGDTGLQYYYTGTLVFSLTGFV